MKTNMQKAGILGGGQLGRMLLQQAANYPVETYVLENDPQSPAAHLCHHFIKGDIRNFHDVYEFGKNLDVLTIEIESVNLQALEKLESEGVKVIPRPSAIRIIKNKIRQKDFYRHNKIPTAPYLVINNREELAQNLHFLPAVQKLGEGGYDGRGVQMLRSEADLPASFDAPSVLEKAVLIDKEIAVIIGINEQGEPAVFPPVEMVFDPQLNQLDYQLCPASLPAQTVLDLEATAKQVVQQFRSPGLFAVELFVDVEGQILVNESAPRVHNSGHHTIEANLTSQFDMLWRILLGYPLGATATLQHSAMVNLVGKAGHSGAARYSGLQDVLSMEGAYVHIYGKEQTKPGRKMGHITFLGETREEVSEKAMTAKKLVQVVAS